MMDSRQEFEKWHKSEYGGYNSCSYSHDTTAYIDDNLEWEWVSWQACQSLNDKRIAELEAKLKVASEALTKLRDCDWVITLPDRMDGVRDIAREALDKMKV